MGLHRAATLGVDSGTHRKVRVFDLLDPVVTAHIALVTTAAEPASVLTTALTGTARDTDFATVDRMRLRPGNRSVLCKPSRCGTCLVSYAFGTVILTTTINLVAGFATG
ncbi:hypothetical protein [Nocardia sp. NPDC058497]|uniref:hypothetical protein n=1 Tax=Nocardia sp. NPDC058497 TaxID=3346529 RepID=UPI003657CB99